MTDRASSPRLFLLVQDEPFFLAEELPRLMEAHHVVGATLLPQRLPNEPITRTLHRYWTLLGPRDFVGVGADLLGRKLTGRGSTRRALRSRGVPLVPAQSINDAAYIAELEALEPDLLVSIACPQILRKPLLCLAPLGAINLHGGYLPDFPGVFTPFWNLYRGSTSAGCTVHFMTAEIDAGPVLARTRFPIDASQSMFEIYARITREGIGLLIDAIDRVAGGTAETEQIRIPRGAYNTFPTPEQAREFRRRRLRVR